MKEWFSFFSFAFIVLLLLLSIANLISGFLRGNVSAMDVLANYLLDLPESISKIMPIACLIASLFSTNKLKNRNELTAIFSSGFSRRDYLLTIFLGALLISSVQFLNTSFIAPLLRNNKHRFVKDIEHKFRNMKSQGLRASTIGTGKMWYKSRDYFFAFSKFNKINNSLTSVSYYKLDDQNRATSIIHAESAQFIDGSNWKLNNVTQHNRLAIKDFPSVTKQDSIILPLNETPDDFKELEADITTLNVLNLRSYISRLESTGINPSEYLVLYYNKFSSSLICIVFALIAAIAIFNPNRRSSSFGRNVTTVFVFTIGYWLIYSYMFELGKSSKVPALLSTFSVPTFFAMLLCIYIYRKRKIS